MPSAGRNGRQLHNLTVLFGRANETGNASFAESPAREATCFKWRKVGHFGVVCRSAKSVDALFPNVHPYPKVA